MYVSYLYNTYICSYGLVTAAANFSPNKAEFQKALLSEWQSISKVEQKECGFCFVFFLIQNHKRRINWLAACILLVLYVHKWLHMYRIWLFNVLCQGSKSLH